MIRTRVKLESQSINFFGGPYQWVPFANVSDISELDINAYLLMFEFKLDMNRTLQYLGFFDFDFELNTLEVQQLKKGVCIKKVTDILTELDLLWPDVPRITYFSGSKGIHVYLMQKDLLVKQSDVLEYMLYLRDIFGDTFANKIDQSPYRTGCGIRPYTKPNPKTDIVPLVLENKNHFCWDTFWAWLYELCDTETFKVIERTDYQAAIKQHKTLDVINRSIYVEECSAVNDIKNLIKREIGKKENVSALNYSFTNKPSSKLWVVPQQLFCFVCNRKHQKNKMVWMIYEQECVQTCLSKPGMMFKFISARSSCTTIPDTIREKVKAVYTIENKYVLDTDLEKAFNTSRFVFVSSPMSTGKTYSLNQLIKKTDSICVIGTRIIQVLFFANYFNATPYNTVQGSLYDCSRVAICINSISRMVDVAGQIKSYDYLVLDEFDSLVKMLTSFMLDSSKTKQRNIWHMFCTLIKTSQRVICMDGIPTERVWSYLDQIKCLSEFVCLEKPSRPEYKHFVFLNNPYNFKNIMKKMLNANKNICVVSTEKKTLKNLAFEFNEVSQLLIHGDSDTFVKETTKEPNFHWSQVQALFYNAAIGPGVSFDNVHFDYIFVWIKPGCADPVELYQLINRIRYVTNRNVYCYLEKSTQSMLKKRTYTEFKQDIVQEQVLFGNKQNQFTTIIETYDGPTGHFTYCNPLHADPTLMLELATKKQIRVNYESVELLDFVIREKTLTHYYRYHDNYIKEFKSLIRRNGGTIAEDYTQVEPEVIAGFKGRGKKITRKRINKNGCKNYLYDSTKLDADIHARVNEIINLENMTPQSMFTAFQHAMQSSDYDLYAEDLKKLKYNASSVSTFLFSTIKPIYQKLFEYLKINYDTETGMIEGEFHSHTYPHKPLYQLYTSGACIFNKRQNQLRDIGPPDASKKQYFRTLIEAFFSPIGYEIKKRTRARQKVLDLSTGVPKEISKLVTVYEVKKSVVHVRNALNGKKVNQRGFFDTHETLTELVNKHII